MSHGGSHSMKGWVLDELASAGRENLDAQHVTRYDGIENAAAAGEVQLLRDFGMDRSSTVVDMGAGTGQFTIAVAPYVRQVIAVDISPVMLSKLKANVARAGHANVQCVLGGFLSYEHSVEPADFVYSRWALHHLPDFRKSIALTRMHDLVASKIPILLIRHGLKHFDSGLAIMGFEDAESPRPIPVLADLRGRMDEPTTAIRHRLPSRRESSPKRAAWRPTPSAQRRSATASGGQGQTTGPPGSGGGRPHRDAGDTIGVAPETNRPQIRRNCPARAGTAAHRRRDRGFGGSHGRRESGLSRSGKFGRGGADDELVKPLNVIQRV